MVNRDVYPHFMVQPVKLGRRTYISELTHIGQHTEIGSYCSIANLCTIGARPHRFDGLSTYPFKGNDGDDKAVKTVIGHDVWIGCNVVVLAGVTVGTGAVIGAGAVVTKDVPPYAIVAGNPAKVLRYRLPQALAAEVMESRWWELPEAEIERLPLRDPAACVAMLKEAHVETV